jgi:hypothetical protein
MQAIDATFDDVALDLGPGRDARRILLWILPGAVVLAFAAGVGSLLVHERPAAAPEIVAARPAAPTTPAPAPVAPSPNAANPYGGLVDFFADSRLAAPGPAFSVPESLAGGPPASAWTNPQPLGVPLPPKRDVARIDDFAPLPPPRPPRFGTPAAPDRRAPPAADKIAGPTAPADNRSIFDKLFGLGRPSGEALAYATPETRAVGSAKDAALAPTDRPAPSIFGKSAPPAGYDKFTAVYDISARVVYMPDGTRLEAHSGLGDRLDDPRYVSERARGATPPDLYDLSPREELFHGVQALRLTPVGDGDVFGRAGLLAHPFMLGPNGDSNGCVSFKDYDAFLRAYQQGQVKRLAVVAKLD